MRVLRVIGGVDPASGGPPVSSVASCLAVTRTGIECTLVFPVDYRSRTTGTVVARALSERGATVRIFDFSRHFKARGRRWALTGPGTVWLLRNVRRYDLVHAHGAWLATTLVALLGARLAGRRTALTPHESLTRFDVEKSGWPTRVAKLGLCRLYLRLVDLFVFSSELERRTSLIGQRRGTSVVIPHPIEVGTRTNGRHSAAQSPLRVGFLGRFDPKKNLAVLLEAVVDMPDVQLVIAGGGERETELRDRAAALGLGDRVIWLGFITRSAKEAFFSSVDLLAMPSTFECFGMAAAEALGRGVPVLVSPTTGIAEIVERHGCGVVVAPQASEIRRELQALRREPAVLGALAARTRDASDDLSHARHGDRLRAEYERLLTESPGRRRPLETS